MACYCSQCGGKGYVREEYERDQFCERTCWLCKGTGGWDEINTPAPAASKTLAECLTDAARVRQGGAA